MTEYDPYATDSDDNEYGNEGVSLVEQYFEDIRRANEEGPGKWYAIVRGRWDKTNGEFQSKVTKDYEEFCKMTQGVWSPVAKSFKYCNDAWGFYYSNIDEVTRRGMMQVHNGVFSKRWYRVDHYKNREYIITHDQTTAIGLAEGHPERDYTMYNNVPDAHARKGEKFELVNEFSGSSRKRIRVDSCQIGQQKCVGLTDEDERQKRAKCED